MQEMIHWHGVILKMSMDNCKVGGFKSYFSPPEKSCLSSTHMHTVNDFPAWETKVFSICRFKQIHAVFHSEVGFSTIGYKCHQLHHMINSLNKAGKRTFIPGKWMSFNKVASHQGNKWILFRCIIKANQTSTKMNCLFLQIVLEDSTLSCTLMFFKARTKPILALPRKFSIFQLHKRY